MTPRVAAFALGSVPTRLPGRSVPPGSAYLTDEVFLHRVVPVVMAGSSAMVELEECYQRTSYVFGCETCGDVGSSRDASAS